MRINEDPKRTSRVLKEVHVTDNGVTIFQDKYTPELVEKLTNAKISHLVISTEDFDHGDRRGQLVSIDIFDPEMAAAESEARRTQLKSFRNLQLFQLILDQRTRERVFDPAFEDLKQQFIESRRFRTKWAKRWIWFAFRFRMGWLIAECVWVMLKASALRFIAAAIPGAISRWWWS